MGQGPGEKVERAELITQPSWGGQLVHLAPAQLVIVGRLPMAAGLINCLPYSNI